MPSAVKQVVVCRAERPVGESSNSAPQDLIGPANETYIKINGVDCLALLDSGSQVSCVSQKFYSEHLAHIELQHLETLIEIEGISGALIPYTGYIEVELVFPGKVLDNIRSMMCLLLISNDTRYNSYCPVLLGTNIICRCMELHDSFVDKQLPMAWKVAFQSLLIARGETTVGVPVTINASTEVPPMSSMVVMGTHGGLPCKSSTILIESDFENNVPGGLLVTPAVYSKSNIDHNIPISVVNTSQKAVTIPSNCIICHASPVTVCFRNTKEPEDIPSEEIRQAFPLEHLTDSQRFQVHQCLQRHKKVFSWSDWDIGHCELNPHRIKLKEEKTFREKYRRIPPAMVEEVRDHLTHMIEAGIIEPSTSPYASAALFVRKPDNTLRFVVDYRRLNELTIKDSHYLPRIDETFDRLAGASWFSTLDLKSGYWQLDMHPEDKHLSAFNVGCLGFYQWRRLAMGLSNSAATFQRVMELVMGSLNLQACLLYLDDIIVFSDSWESHLARLELVLSKLEDAGLKLKPSKCCLFQKQIKYLGHIISEEGLATDPSKIEKVIAWPVPTERHQLHRFLAFCGYYRRFIKDFSNLASPLQKLLRGIPDKDGKSVKRTNKGKSKIIYPAFEWGPEQQSAFDKLKEVMTSTPVLAFADFRKPFTLQIDASGQGLGAVLSQEVDGRQHPVAFASRGLTPTESRYPAHKLEFLAMKWAICEKFYDYLYGNQFEVITDNCPLTYVFKTSKLDATGLRWVAALSAFNFTVKYRPGRLNSAADALSRLENEYAVLSDEAVKALYSGVGKDELVSTVSMSASVVPDLPTSADKEPPDWTKLQKNDPVIGVIVRALLNKEAFQNDHPEVRELWKQRKKLLFVNDVLYRRCQLPDGLIHQLVLPECARREAIQAMHDDMGHFGRDRVIDLLRSRVYWPFMKEDVSRYIARCESCLKRKKPQPIAELVSIETSSPMELVSMDFLCLETSVGGYSNILVLTDHFTRFAMATPTRNQLAKTAAKALIDLFINHYGMPQRLHSDKGANFVGKVITEMCKLLGIKRSTTTSFHAMGNGQVERFNRTLLDMLGTLPDSKKSRWKEYVQPLVHAYNCTRNDVTGFTPFELMFGRTPRLPLDDMFGLSTSCSDNVSYVDFVSDLKKRLEESYQLARKNITKNQQSSKEYYDRRVRGNILEVGDRVLVRKTYFQEGRHKLANRWEDQVYVVENQVDELPVFDIRPENGKGRKKRLHRNNLLPIESAVSRDEADDSSSSEEEVQEPPEVVNADVNADTVADVVPVIPAGRPSHPVEQIPVSEDNKQQPRQPVSTTPARETEPVRNVEPERESPQEAEISEHDSDQSGDTEQDENQPVPPRRSKRKRQLPVRFQSGDYVLSQQSQGLSRDDKLKFLSKLLEFLD